MQEIRENTPKEVNVQVDLQVKIANRIYELLEEKAMTQKEFAKLVGKTETEVSRWLSGTHNLTLATIAKISVALNDDIIQPTSRIKPYDTLPSNGNKLCYVADEGQEYRKLEPLGDN